MRVLLPHLRSGTLAFVFCIILLAAARLAAQPPGDASPAQAHVALEPRPVLLFSSQHPLPEESWAAVFAALKKDLPEVEGLVPDGDAHPELVRAGYAADGELAGKPITVYLLGDCLPPPLKIPFPGIERLGWVSEVDGKIVPIIHVECTQIGAEISGQTEWMNKKRRTEAMSDAIARVILHEWVHVATQSAAHGSDGLIKPIFGVDDLLCGEAARNCGVAGRCWTGGGGGVNSLIPSPHPPLFIAKLLQTKRLRKGCGCKSLILKGNVLEKPHSIEVRRVLAGSRGFKLASSAILD